MVSGCKSQTCKYTTADTPTNQANQQTRNTSTTTTDTITTQLSVAMGAMGCGDGLYSWLSMVAISNALDGDWLRPRHTPPPPATIILYDGGIASKSFVIRAHRAV